MEPSGYTFLEASASRKPDMEEAPLEQNPQPEMLALLGPLWTWPPWLLTVVCRLLQLMGLTGILVACQSAMLRPRASAVNVGNFSHDPFSEDGFDDLPC